MERPSASQDLYADARSREYDGVLTRGLFSSLPFHQLRFGVAGRLYVISSELVNVAGAHKLATARCEFGTGGKLHCNAYVR
jgi:hypothetical protein